MRVVRVRRWPASRSCAGVSHSAACPGACTGSHGMSQGCGLWVCKCGRLQVRVCLQCRAGVRDAVERRAWETEAGSRVLAGHAAATTCRRTRWTTAVVSLPTRSCLDTHRFSEPAAASTKVGEKAECAAAGTTAVEGKGGCETREWDRAAAFKAAHRCRRNT